MIRRLQLLLAALLMIGVIGVAAPVYAADTPAAPDNSVVQNDICSKAQSAGGELPAACKDVKSTDNPIYGPKGVITKVVNVLAMIIGVAAVIIIIVAGIQYMLSTGDPTKVGNAKNTIIYAVVGLAVAVFARTLIVFFLGKTR